MLTQSTGVILTMSAAKGIDYVTRDLPIYLDDSPETTCNNPSASALAHLRTHFETTGTQMWHKSTVEYFLVFLLTELAVTPHNGREGYNAISVLDGFQAVVRNLVSIYVHDVDIRLLMCVWDRKREDTTTGNGMRR